jgi:hypothetical protein
MPPTGQTPIPDMPSSTWYEYGMRVEDQRAVIRQSYDVIGKFTGKRPTGWLGPAIGVHPYVTGAAHRIKYFEELYDYISRHDVVHWTGQQIYGR